MLMPSSTMDPISCGICSIAQEKVVYQVFPFQLCRL